MNWTLLLITEGISLLDLWKYANSMLICTSNYVPFNVRQSGTFTRYLTGKFINSVWSLKNDSGLRGLCGETIVSEDGMLHRTSPRLLSSTVWVTASGVRFLKGRLLEKKKILLKCVENMWSLYPVSFQRTKDIGIWIVPPGVPACFMMCTEGQWTSTMSTFQESRKTTYF